MRAILYSRVSTEEQASTGISLEAQQTALAAYANQRKWGWAQWAEEGVSAKTLDRPVLQAALHALSTGKMEVLVVTKLDRLSRSMVDFAQLVEQSQREGWAIVAIDQALDLTTPTGRLFAHLLAALAQWEREMIGQRTKDALSHKKSKGEKLGPPVKVEAGTVSYIQTMRSTGASFRNVANGLNAAGVVAPKGGSWTPAAVRGVFERHIKPNPVV